MTYQVLARKWRPGSFREMVGQQHVLRALINALDHDRLHHAYLFTGTRGVGKTTVARILARCLNCETGVSSEPCGQCDTCREIAENRSVDLIEVDAASRTKVEDTRELLDNVQYSPTRSRYKIYLIDEVHMLSGHSFNALLKTLEEPPPHAKFLLATTDPQKLPATVLSRCLQFNLKNMVPDQIVEHLEHILAQESIGFEREALKLLARAAAGSMRDALSLTDQAIGYGSGTLNSSDVQAMLGTVDRGRVLDLVAAVLDDNPEQILAVVARIAEHAPDYAATLDEMVSIFHQMTIALMVPGAMASDWQDQARVLELTQRSHLDDIQLFYQFAVNGRRDLMQAHDPRIALEMILLRMVAFRPAAIIDMGDDGGAGHHAPAKTANRNVPEPVNGASGGVASASSAAPEARNPGSPSEGERPQGQGESSSKKPEPPVLPVAAADEDLPSPQSWPELFESLGLVGITQTIALHCELVAVEGRRLRFVLDENNATLYQPRQAKALELAFNQWLEAPVEIEITIGQVGSATPHHCRQAQMAARQVAAEQAIANDSILAQLLAEFDGQLIDGTIRPPQ
jgi:DNA polymerase-3 subunit gamma/tau